MFNKRKEGMIRSVEKAPPWMVLNELQPALIRDDIDQGCWETQKQDWQQCCALEILHWLKLWRLLTVETSPKRNF